MLEDSRWRATRPCDLNSSASRMPEKRRLRQLFYFFTPPHSRCDRDTKTPRISGTWSDECLARSCEDWFDLPAPPAWCDAKPLLLLSGVMSSLEFLDRTGAYATNFGTHVQNLDTR